MNRRLHCLRVIAFCILLPIADAAAASDPIPDAGCEAYTAWQIQSNVRSDPTGRNNVAFPEANATYWASLLDQPIGTVITVKGRYPKARYTALQVYDEQRNVMGAINDQDIQPDAGTNNPFRTGFEQGTYTVKIVFGRSPLRPSPNTIYTAGLTKVILLYRIYYSNFPEDLTAATFDPVLPQLSTAAGVFTSCPPRPIITPEDLTVWGRLDNGEWAGTPPPPGSRSLGTNPPVLVLTVPSRITPYYPSADNSYMSALLSREYLMPPYAYDMVVMRMRAPTMPDTQAGEPPYLALTDRQVRFWSICQYDKLSTGVNRCVEDNQALNVNGFVTVVVSDPSKRPSDDVLALQGARWMSWGALQNGDMVYDIDQIPVGNDKPVYYYGSILYRQTLSNPAWDKSMTNIGNNYPRNQQKGVMGDYWPVIGYCSAANFATYGINCIGK